MQARPAIRTDKPASVVKSMLLKLIITCPDFKKINKKPLLL
jgi:hypothetical protein